MLGRIGHFRNFDHEKTRIHASFYHGYGLAAPLTTRYDTRGVRPRNAFPHPKSIQMVTLDHYRTLYHGVDSSYLQHEPNFHQDVYEADTRVFPSRIHPLDSSFLPQRRSNIYDVVSC